MGKMQQFKREIRSSNGRFFAFDLRNGFGAVLGGLFEKVARGKVHDAEIREIYGAEDDEDGPKVVRVGLDSEAGAILTPSAKQGKYTALVSLHGVALYNLEYQPYCFSTLLLSQVMENLANDASVDTIVLDINTPGGHVTGTQEAADAVYKAARKKNVVGIINPLCASAGYWIGSQCSKLIAVPSADIGSIGVFMCHYDCSAMMADFGVKPTFIYAGEHKVEGNSMEPLGEEARKFFQSEVDQIYDDFLSAVARGRGVSKDVVLAKFGKGRCYAAPMAKRLGMVDEVSTIRLALHSVGLMADMPTEGGRRRGEEQVPDTSAETSGQDQEVEGAAPDAAESAATANDGPQPIVFREDRTADGGIKIYVTSAWPAKAAIDVSVQHQSRACVHAIGNVVTIQVENGAAVYTKLSEDAVGVWICALADGSGFEDPPPVPAAEDTSDRSAAEAEARRRRLALLNA